MRQLLDPFANSVSKNNISLHPSPEMSAASPQIKSKHKETEAPIPNTPGSPQSFSSLLATPSPFSLQAPPTPTLNRQTVSILLVDDDARFRQGIRTLLGFCGDKGNYNFVVVGEAASGRQALELVKEQHPMLVILDVELTQGKIDGIEVLSELQKQPNRPKTLMMSAHQEDDVIFRCMQAGAFGYVPKSQIAEQLYKALTTVLQDQVYLGATSATAFFRIFHFHAGRSLRACQAIHLSPREHEVLSFLVEGYSNETIAKSLYISVATVKAHLTSVFEKLSVKSRTQAIVAALKLGLV
ncbi:MAG: response regulator transcription factor [Cyanobacteria bacterium P01_F01_bin.150]